MHKILDPYHIGFRFICLAIALLFFVVPFGLQSAPVRDWTNIQIVIYENRLSGTRPECSDQHLNQRIYARKIHQNLDKKGRWPFVVDARSSIDKILISLKIRASTQDYAIIQSRLEEALHAPTSQALMAAELRLLSGDENARLSKPSQNEMFLQQLARTYGPKLAIDCGTIPGENLALFGVKQNAMPAYQIFFLTEQQMLGTQAVAARKPSKKYVGRLTQYVEPQGVYSRPIKEQTSGEDQETPPSQTLFVALVGDYSAQQHIIAMAKISRAARDAGLASPDIRPFGIGGFLINAEPNALITLKKNLSNTIKVDTSDMNRFADILFSDATASSAICHARAGTDFQLWIETTLTHPYFEFWMNAPECKDDKNKLWDVRKKFYEKPTIFYTQFLVSK
jgi:hypothetical protein